MNKLINPKVKIREFKNWVVYLHPYQCYLGRTYLWAKREDAFDYMEMTQHEWDDFRYLGVYVKNVLDEIFSPDMFNYAALGNVAPHLHVHIIPRYKKARYFQGIEFKDTRWGENYAPYDKDFFIPLEVHLQIADVIRNGIKEKAYDSF